jgi:HPt (histidine-containing phosphotransfer) domain-containing protein
LRSQATRLATREHALLSLVSEAHKAKSFALAAHVDRMQALAASLEHAAAQSRALVGGSDVAAELDAKRAINQASRLAAAI